MLRNFLVLVTVSKQDDEDDEGQDNNQEEGDDDSNHQGDTVSPSVSTFLLHFPTKFKIISF